MGPTSRRLLDVVLQFMSLAFHAYHVGTIIVDRGGVRDVQRGGVSLSPIVAASLRSQETCDGKEQWRDRLNQRRIPHPYKMAAAFWGNPAEFPLS